MTMLNLARFTINGTPAEDSNGKRGYDAAPDETLACTLERNPATGVLTVTYAVFDPAEPDSPLASKDATLQFWDANDEHSITSAAKNDSFDLTVDDTTDLDSFVIRCTVVTATGAQVWERLVCVRREGLRMTIPAETQQYDQRGWSDAMNELTEYVATGGATLNPPGPGDDGKVAVALSQDLTYIFIDDDQIAPGADIDIEKLDYSTASNGDVIVMVAGVPVWAPSPINPPADPGDDDEVAFATGGELDYADGIKVLNSGTGKSQLAASMLAFSGEADDGTHTTGTHNINFQVSQFRHVTAGNPGPVTLNLKDPPSGAYGWFTLRVYSAGTPTINFTGDSTILWDQTWPAPTAPTFSLNQTRVFRFHWNGTDWRGHFDPVFETANPAVVEASGQSPGTSFNISRSDHKHQASTAVAGTLSPGQTAGTGGEATLARSDHIHALPVTSAAIACDATAGTVGSDGKFVHGDHKHQIATSSGDPANVYPNQTASAGTADELARADHRHANYPFYASFPQNVDASSPATGSQNAYARGDHKHQASVGGAGSSVDAGAGNPGSASTLSRSDHGHTVLTGDAGQMSPIQIGDTANGGSDNDLARIDHRHQFQAYGSIPTIVDGTSGSIGSSVLPARGDHRHQMGLATAIPHAIEIGTGGPGTSVTPSREDHEHPLYWTAAALWPITIPRISDPGTPPGGYFYLWGDSTTNRVHLRYSDGTTWDLTGASS